MRKGVHMKSRAVLEAVVARLEKHVDAPIDVNSPCTILKALDHLATMRDGFKRLYEELATKVGTAPQVKEKGNPASDFERVKDVLAEFMHAYTRVRVERKMTADNVLFSIPYVQARQLGCWGIYDHWPTCKELDASRKEVNSK